MGNFMLYCQGVECFDDLRVQICHGKLLPYTYQIFTKTFYTKKFVNIYAQILSV